MCESTVLFVKAHSAPCHLARLNWMRLNLRAPLECLRRGRTAGGRGTDGWRAEMMGGSDGFPDKWSGRERERRRRERGGGESGINKCVGVCTCCARNHKLQHYLMNSWRYNDAFHILFLFCFLNRGAGNSLFASLRPPEARTSWKYQSLKKLNVTSSTQHT